MFLECVALSEEEKLLHDMFLDYNPSARPVMNSSKTVDVEIQFSLMHIKELVSILIR
jgi:hypothetical protein